MKESIDKNVERLVQYFNINEGYFEPITQRTPYYNMGATITDAVLQAGLNYKNVVYPRILNLLQRYSQYKTTCDFIILMQTIQLSELINFNNKRKLSCIYDLSWFFYNLNIQDEDNLSIWLASESNVTALYSIRGIGPKTVDYLKMLCGCQSIAVDRHLFAFLRFAGVVVKTYEEANEIYSKASRVLGITQYELDKKVWTLMSNKNPNLSPQRSLS